MIEFSTDFNVIFVLCVLKANVKMYYSAFANVVQCSDCERWRVVPRPHAEPTQKKWVCKDATWMTMKCSDCDTQMCGDFSVIFLLFFFK